MSDRITINDLPGEILNPIWHFLGQDLLLLFCPDWSGPHGQSTNQVDHSAASEAIRDLKNASLVCKKWRDEGLDLILSKARINISHILPYVPATLNTEDGSFLNLTGLTLEATSRFGHRMLKFENIIFRIKDVAIDLSLPVKKSQLIVLARMHEVKEVYVTGLDNFKLRGRETEIGGLVSQVGKDFINSQWHQVVGKAPDGTSWTHREALSRRYVRLQKVVKAVKSHIDDEKNVPVITVQKVVCVEPRPFEARMRDEVVEREWTAETTLSTKKMVLKSGEVHDHFFIEDLSVE